MRTKLYIFILLMSLLVTSAVKANNDSASSNSREYRIKAAFLFNFIKFIDWPETEDDDEGKPIIIGIIGTDLFGDAFAAVTNKQIKGRNTTVKRFGECENIGLVNGENTTGANEKIDSPKECHLLFVCDSEREHAEKILSLLENDDVLTVSDMPGFLKAGGIINFLLVENKVRFEINLVSATKANLQIRSQLLRLATNVIDDK